MPKVKSSSPDRTVKVGGKSLQLKFSIRAMIALQDRWGLSDDPDMAADGAKSATDKVQDRIAKAAMADFVTIVWAATRSKHPELTEEDVLEMLDEAGLEGLHETLSSVMSAATPPPPKPGSGPR